MNWKANAPLLAAAALIAITQALCAAWIVATIESYATDDPGWRLDEIRKDLDNIELNTRPRY